MIPSVKKTSTPPRSALACMLALGAIAALPLGGCRGDRTDKPPRRFFPDMDLQPKHKAQAETEFFADGMTQRPLVEGVVPFSDHSVLPDDVMILSGPRCVVRIARTCCVKTRPTTSGLVSGSTPENPSWAQRMPVEVTRGTHRRGCRTVQHLLCDVPRV